MFCSVGSNWLLIIVRHLLHNRSVVVFTKPSRCSVFSQLALSNCARIKIKFQGDHQRLFFSGTFVFLKIAQISTPFRNLCNFTNHCALNEQVRMLRPKMIFISSICIFPSIKVYLFLYDFLFCLIFGYVLCAEIHPCFKGFWEDSVEERI